MWLPGWNLVVQVQTDELILINLAPRENIIAAPSNA